jgi:peroxiredoxin
VFAHKVWAESLKLSYLLPSDFNNEVAKKYGIFRDESYADQVKLANEHAIFVVDK